MNKRYETKGILHFNTSTQRRDIYVRNQMFHESFCFDVTRQPHHDIFIKKYAGIANDVN